MSVTRARLTWPYGSQEGGPRPQTRCLSVSGASPLPAEMLAAGVVVVVAAVVVVVLVLVLVVVVVVLVVVAGVVVVVVVVHSLASWQASRQAPAPGHSCG